MTRGYTNGEPALSIYSRNARSLGDGGTGGLCAIQPARKNHVTGTPERQLVVEAARSRVAIGSVSDLDAALCCAVGSHERPSLGRDDVDLGEAAVAPREVQVRHEGHLDLVLEALDFTKGAGQEEIFGVEDLRRGARAFVANLEHVREALLQHQLLRGHPRGPGRVVDGYYDRGGVPRPGVDKYNDHYNVSCMRACESTQRRCLKRSTTTQLGGNG